VAIPENLPVVAVLRHARFEEFNDRRHDSRQRFERYMRFDVEETIELVATNGASEKRPPCDLSGRSRTAGSSHETAFPVAACSSLGGDISLFGRLS
jgi:hypothetical protein